MIYDYIIIFQFPSGYFKYRMVSETNDQTPFQLVEGAWEKHYAEQVNLCKAHPELPDEFQHLEDVESIEVIALHTIPFERVS